jgi:hypothetical protein
MNERQCVVCTGDISACFGFVLARDFLVTLQNQHVENTSREVCGKCVLILTPQEVDEIISESR